VHRDDSIGHLAEGTLKELKGLMLGHASSDHTAKVKLHDFGSGEHKVGATSKLLRMP